MEIRLSMASAAWLQQGARPHCMLDTVGQRLSCDVGRTPDWNSSPLVSQLLDAAISSSSFLVHQQLVTGNNARQQRLTLGAQHTALGGPLWGPAAGAGSAPVSQAPRQRQRWSPTIARLRRSASAAAGLPPASGLRPAACPKRKKGTVSDVTVRPASDEGMACEQTEQLA